MERSEHPTLVTSEHTTADTPAIPASVHQNGVGIGPEFNDIALVSIVNPTSEQVPYVAGRIADNIELVAASRAESAGKVIELLGVDARQELIQSIIAEFAPGARSSAETAAREILLANIAELEAEILRLQELIDPMTDFQFEQIKALLIDIAGLQQQIEQQAKRQLRAEETEVRLTQEIATSKLEKAEMAQKVQALQLANDTLTAEKAANATSNLKKAAKRVSGLGKIASDAVIGVFTRTS